MTRLHISGWLPIVASAVAVGCIDVEDTRPYGEFVEEYRVLADVDLPDVGASNNGANEDVDFGAPGTACSPSTGEAASITFVNATGEAGTVYWVDFQCREVSYGDIPPGGEKGQGTFVGHIWRLRNSAGQFRGEVVVEGPGPVEFGVPE